MSSIWDKNGRAHIPVLQAHIDTALARHSSHCVIAESIKSACPAARWIAVDLATIRWTTPNGVRLVFLTPHAARAVIIHTDQAERDLIKPFVLKMKPAIVCRGGKRRDHTPSNSDLKEAAPGLRISKKQLHLGDAGRESSKMELRQEPGQESEECQNGHLRNRKPERTFPLDPDREDGLARPPPPPKPKRRVARGAMVSAADRGSVPTVIGGRPPPVSILSRREYGLRQLRK
jgi:hypothetical protein